MDKEKQRCRLRKNGPAEIVGSEDWFFARKAAFWLEYFENDAPGETGKSGRAGV